MSFHEEEVLGKAYDARLMRRLLAYLRPHKTYVVGALLALIGDAVIQLAPPYLVKIAIDQYIAQGDLSGLNTIAIVYLAVLLASFSLEYAQTYMMQMIGQRIMFDMRMQIYTHLQRLDLAFYDRNPVGRLMTRVTTDVDVINVLKSLPRSRYESKQEVMRDLAEAARRFGRGGLLDDDGVERDRRNIGLDMVENAPEGHTRHP